jgi:Tfp pilus assembly protein PilF
MARRKRQSRRSATTADSTLIFFLAYAGVLLTFAVLGWLVFGRAIDAPFIFDDLVSVEDNPSITRLWPPFGTKDRPGPLSPPRETPTAARPVVNLSFALNYCAGYSSPRGYRVVNLLIHVVNATLLWALVRSTLKLPHLRGRFAESAGWLAFAAAMLWLVHPLTTEAVIYITQRSELLVAFFYLATLYASIRYWEALEPSTRTAWLMVAILACFGGAGSKEVMVTAPIAVLLFERTFVSGSFRQAVRNSWPLYVGLFASWLLIGALQLSGPRSLSAGFAMGEPLVEYWSTQAGVFLMYLRLVVIPIPLLIHYELALGAVAENWLPLLFVFGLVAAALYLLWKNTSVGFLAACVLLVLAPTHLVPIPTEMAAERRMYLPLMAIAALVVIGGYAVIGRLLIRNHLLTDQNSYTRWTVVATAALLVVTMAYGRAAARRAAHYNDPVVLWGQVALLQPNSHVAHHGLAVQLFEQQRIVEAIEHYRQALRLHHDYPEAQYGLGLALLQIGKYDEAVGHLREAARLKPNAERIRNNLGVALFSAGRFSEAAQVFSEVVNNNPQMWQAHDNLGRALRMAGRVDEAQEHFQEAARLQQSGVDN